MKIVDIQTTLVSIPQKPPIAPYQSRYRATSTKEAGIIRVQTDEGLVGWGEVPQDYFGTRPFTGSEAVRLGAWLAGADPLDIEGFWVRWPQYSDDERLASGVEMALWDIAGKAAGLPLHALLGGCLRPRIELAACMGIQPYQRAGELARLYVAMGFRTLKTKAGRDPHEDLEMVRGVRDAVGDALALRIDPNTGYPPDVATRLARDLEPYHLQYFEQPMPAHLIAEAAQLRRAGHTPIALNESVTSLAVVLDILRQGAADYLLPDTYQSGGILGIRKTAALAEAAGVSCVMHCAHDLGPKTAAMLHIAAALPSFRLANDCTYYGLADDVLPAMIPIERGTMTVPTGPGLGVEVDPAKLERYRVAGPGGWTG